jgi:hypothetical protein
MGLVAITIVEPHILLFLKFGCSLVLIIFWGESQGQYTGDTCIVLIPMGDWCGSV